MKTTFVYTLTGEQIGAAIRHRNQQLVKRMPLRRLIQAVVYLAWIATAVVFFAAHERGGSLAIRIALYVMAAGYTLYYLLYSRAMERLYRTDNHLVDITTELKIEDDGLYFSSGNSRSVIIWSGL
jgi:Zn-dependent protease with chaperone function